MSYRKWQGTTLVETMLVLVVAAMIIYMLLQYTIQRAEQRRVERTAMQMQQILAAAQAYYSLNGNWPSSAQLQDFVTPGLLNSSPWGGGAYLTRIAPATGINQFYVYTTITSTSQKSRLLAAQVAGLLPMGFVTGAGATPPVVSLCIGVSCRVVGMANVPPQMLNRARGITWSGLVRHGGCIPMIPCPSGTTPQVMVMPAGISGVNDRSSASIYPISSFTAYAKGPVGPGVRPPYCDLPATFTTEITTHCEVFESTFGHWRACAKVITEKGDVAETRGNIWPGNEWGNYITLLAVTRCTTTGEASGGGFTVFTN